jgi:hypothetical protein
MHCALLQRTLEARRAENPRVGSSILSLATIKQLIHQHFLALKTRQPSERNA